MSTGKAIEWTDTIRVKTANGVETRTFRFRKTHHGPVLGLRNSSGGVVQALTVRAVSAGGGVMAQRWAMAKARNLADFKAALAKTTLTGSNTIYADVAGNIFYVHGNGLPKRNAGVDWLKPMDWQ
jgi:penicillin amidase